MKTTGTCMWAYTKQPDTKYEACWRVTILMSDAEAKKLKDIGIAVKRNDDGVFEYKFKRNVARKDGNGDNPPPRVVDAEKEPFDGIIGNGSIVNVQWAPYQWKFKKGVGADLQAIQVVKLVPYGGGAQGSGDEFEVLEGQDGFDKVDEASKDDDF